MCEHIKPEVKKKIQQQWLELQMKLVYGDEMKIAIWWRRNETFDSGRCKLIKEDFSGGKGEGAGDC